MSRERDYGNSGKDGEERRAGDWDCPKCNAMCFGSKDACYKCGETKPGLPRRRPGDWDCPQCGVNVFASKSECFKCRCPKPRPMYDHYSPYGYDYRRAPPPRREPARGGRLPDWDCPACGARDCFGSKPKCFKCGAPNPATQARSYAPPRYAHHPPPPSDPYAPRDPYAHPPPPRDPYGHPPPPSDPYANNPYAPPSYFARGPPAPALPKDFRRGDWFCPKCGKHCFASKDKCFSCNAEKPGSRGGYQRREGDWDCAKCGATGCFGSKSTCFKCGEAKPAEA